MSEPITPPITLGAWKVRYLCPDGTGKPYWSIEQPDGTERARFASAQVMAEHYALMTEYCDRLKEAVEGALAVSTDQHAEIERLHAMIRYAIEAPNPSACRLQLLDALHGCTGAGNVDEVRRKPEHAADARRLGIEVAK